MFLNLFAFSQSKEKIIHHIKLRFIEINQVEDYLVHQLKLNTKTGESTLKGYFKDEKIHKIEEIQSLSYGRLTRLFFFDNGELIYVYEKEEHYPEKGKSVKKTVKAYEAKYYYNRKKVLEWSQSGAPKSRDLKETLAQRQKEFIELAAKYLVVLSKKK